MRKLVYDLLERIVVKTVLHLFKISATFPAFLVSELVSHGFDKFVVPLIDLLVRQGQLYYDTNEGKIKASKALRARRDGKKDDYNRAVDDIFH